MLAALKYEAKLNEVCEKLAMMKAAGGNILMGPTAEEQQELEVLREASVREYSASLRRDQEQRIAESMWTKG